MRWPFTKSDLLFVIAIAYLATDLIFNWNAYRFCSSPIQLFLLFNYCFFFIIRIHLTLVAAADLPRGFKSCLMSLFYWVLNPLCIYLPVQGIIWQIQNMVNSPDCIPAKRIPSIVWLWIISLIFMAILMTFITAMKLRNWWRMYVFQRRMRRLAHGLGHEDANALTVMLLGDQGLNNRVGLLEADIDRLPKATFSTSLADMFRFNQQDSCPICFDEFQAGNEVTQLPSCNHIYHPACIREWLNKSPLCPMCRSNVRTHLYNDILRQNNIQAPNPQGDIPENMA